MRAHAGLAGHGGGHREVWVSHSKQKEVLLEPVEFGEGQHGSTPALQEGPKRFVGDWSRKALAWLLTHQLEDLVLECWSHERSTWTWGHGLLCPFPCSVLWRAVLCVTAAPPPTGNADVQGRRDTGFHQHRACTSCLASVLPSSPLNQAGAAILPEKADGAVKNPVYFLLKTLKFNKR